MSVLFTCSSLETNIIIIGNIKADKKIQKTTKGYKKSTHKTICEYVDSDSEIFLPLCSGLYQKHQLRENKHFQLTHMYRMAYITPG